MIPVGSRHHPLVLAHRGGGAEAPENSLEAFAHAHALGVRDIETDAHLTADGQVVLIHDPVVDRVSEGSGRVRDLTWAEICGLQMRGGTRVPLLGEVLEAFPDMVLNIDAKVEEVVDPLLDVLEEHEALDRVLIASFSERRLSRVRSRTAGAVATSLGSTAVVRLLLAAHSATDPMTWHVPGPRQGVRAVQVPASYGPVPVVTPRMLATAHRAGLAVHVWTVDEEAEMLRLLDLGVDGIVTDRPSLLRDLLRARGQWREPTTSD
ncbi:MAG: glycerophosphodiester phosphodiesterase [Propionibacterium sp.]|nr:glycerophosphodiester phosphodiesterase [Propionibacterium sp.]MDN6566052.1 glycerophosphodiester phosphodiesterase [Actinomyces sp.]MDN6794384.1 glycerophosphodiester phosphodiesterase [Propionibacterium sp.]